MSGSTYMLGRAVLLLGCTARIGSCDLLDLRELAEPSLNGSEPHLQRFHDYMARHGRTYQSGTEEYERRFALFRERVTNIDAHNSQPDRLWSATVNHLTDRTEKELLKLRGYRRAAPSSSRGGRQAAGFLSHTVRTVDVSHLPTGWTWRDHLQAMDDVRDQGSCGSCWAFAVGTVLRAHSELYQRDRTFSVQQMVSCTPNPNKCGGSGGCEGATAELAMDYVQRVGLTTDSDMEYASAEETCPPPMRMPRPTLRSLLRTQFRLEEGAGRAQSFGMTSWRKLPENKVEPLLLALYEQGPVAASVMANDAWNAYGGGILNSCERDAVINHAVTLVGYGEEQGTKFFQIQNSWGPSWGERGHIRLLRRPRHEENEYCGWDSQPEQGTGCAGGPPKVYVCGSCGILYDSVVPSFRLSEEGWLARHQRSRLTRSQLLQLGAHKANASAHPAK